MIDEGWTTYFCGYVTPWLLFYWLSRTWTPNINSYQACGCLPIVSAASVTTNGSTIDKYYTPNNSNDNIRDDIFFFESHLVDNRGLQRDISDAASCLGNNAMPPGSSNSYFTWSLCCSYDFKVIIRVVTGMRKLKVFLLWNQNDFFILRWGGKDNQNLWFLVNVRISGQWWCKDQSPTVYFWVKHWRQQPLDPCITCSWQVRST